MKYQINEHLTLRLENDKTMIHIKGVPFLHCKYLLFTDPQNYPRQEEIQSIDDAEKYLNNEMEERSITQEVKISPEMEFWGHCSNLQAWHENDYDTRLLHRNLAFPLLIALANAGDPLALKTFKDEIAKRFVKGNDTVRYYLIEEGYLSKYLSKEELATLQEITGFYIPQIQTYIYYDPSGRGVRVAVSYLEKEGYIYGYYHGYCGGGCWTDNLFRIEGKFEKLRVVGEGDEFWDCNVECKEFSEDVCEKKCMRITNTERKLLDITMRATHDFYATAEDFEFCSPRLDTSRLNEFTKYEDEDGEIQYYYETEGFGDDILPFLSEHWGLLTSYFRKEQVNDGA